MSRSVTEPKARTVHQQGYVLLLVAVFLIILTATSVHFVNELGEYTNVSGTARDSSASLMIAESALEHLRGTFLSGVSQCAAIPANCDPNAQNICETIKIKDYQSSPDACLENYMYYVNSGGAGTGIDQTQPSLLQRVASGEAASVSAQQTSRKIASNVTQLSVNDLSGTGFGPNLFILNSNGRLVPSAVANWTTSLDKAAAWIEVVQNNNDPNAIDLVVQAVGQSGDSKSYVQRYIGTFYPSNTLGSGLSVLTEASPIQR